MKLIKQFDLVDKDMQDFQKKPMIIQAKVIDEEFAVETMEGIMQGKKGDYLVKGIEGELYPCDRRIFEKSYTKVK